MKSAFPAFLGALLLSNAHSWNRSPQNCRNTWKYVGKHGKNLGIGGGVTKVAKFGAVPCPRSSKGVCKRWIFIAAFSKHWERGLRASGEVWGSLVALGNHPGHSPSPPFPGWLHFLPAGAQSILINPKETPGDLRAEKSFGGKSLFQRLITFNWINPFGSGIIFCSCFVQLVPETSQVQFLCSWCWGGCGEGFPSWEDFSTPGNGFSLLERLWESFNCADKQQDLAVLF